MNIKNITWKGILTFFPILIFLTSFRQDADQKNWDIQSPLTWEDYKRVDRPDDYEQQNGSNTFIGEIYRYKRLESDSNSYIFDFQVKSVMIRSKSYVDPKSKTSALLTHEQLHFDISEYFARQLLQAFKEGKYTMNYKMK
jgi:hypothetical protein